MTDRELDALTEEITATIKKRLLVPILDAIADNHKALLAELAELRSKVNATHTHVITEDEDDDDEDDDDDGLPKWVSHPIIAPHVGSIMSRLAEPGAVDRLLDKFLGPAKKE